MKVNQIIRAGAYSLKTYPLVHQQHPQGLASVRLCTPSQPDLLDHQQGSVLLMPHVLQYCLFGILVKCSPDDASDP